MNGASKTSLLRGVIAVAASLLLVSACWVFYASEARAQFADGRVIDYPLDGVVLGNGWVAAKAVKTAGLCIEFQEVADLAEDRTLDLSRVLDKEQLNRELNVSVEFQIKALGAGGSAKAKYARSLEVKNEALNLAIIARVQQGARFVSAKPSVGAVRLNSDALQLAKTNLREFVVRCGDAFVAAIQGGGELNALLSFSIASREERESVSASMAASGMTWSGSVKMSQTMKQYRESERLKILMHSSGGSGVPIPANETELLERLRNLPADAKAAPKPFSITLGRYDHLPNWPKATLPAVRFAEMEALVGQWQRFSSLYIDMFSVLQKPDDYIFRSALTLDSVRAMQDELRVQHLPRLQARIEECLNGQSCETPAQDAILDYEFRARLPVREGSFQEDIRLGELRALLSKSKVQFAQTPATVLIGLNQKPNPKKADLAKRISNVEKQIEQGEARFGEALATASVLVRVMLGVGGCCEMKE